MERPACTEYFVEKHENPKGNTTGKDIWVQKTTKMKLYSTSIHDLNKISGKSKCFQALRKVTEEFSNGFAWKYDILNSKHQHVQHEITNLGGIQGNPPFLNTPQIIWTWLSQQYINDISAYDRFFFISILSMHGYGWITELK